MSYEKRISAWVDDKEEFKPLFQLVPKLCPFKRTDPRTFHLRSGDDPCLPGPAHLGSFYKFDEAF
jgi:hypothetical protein